VARNFANEDAFNAYISKELGRLTPHTAKLKMAEKYHIGVPDFCVWRGGRSVVFECKFIPGIIKPGKLLKHPFTGTQLTFLQALIRAGVPSFGVIGCGINATMWLLPANLITSHGNWVAEDFWAATKNLIRHDFSDIPGLVDSMFSHHVVGGSCILKTG
jgi:hypothetical protein